jgi:predicted alpha/beta-hydrolase family hydrolase
MPTLCINGTRDSLCRRDLMEEVLARVKPAFRMHWLEGADHSFHVLKSSGRTDPEVMVEIGETVRAWSAS